MSRTLSCVVLLSSLIFGVCSFCGAAEEATSSVRLHWAKPYGPEFGADGLGDFGDAPESNYDFGIDWGKRLSDTLFKLPIEMTANLGVQYFAEGENVHDAWGITAYVKAHYSWRLPLTQKHVRFGLGEGLSYVTRIPMSEQLEFARKGAVSDKLTHYTEWTIDVPLGQFRALEPLIGDPIKEAYIGLVVRRRASALSLFDESKVTFVGVGFEARY